MAGDPGTGLKVQWSLVRGYVQVFQARGVLDQVRQGMPPETRQLLDQSRMALGWVDQRVLDEVVDSAGRLRGRDFIRDCALENTRLRAGPLVFPLIRTLMTLWGAQPDTLFKRANTLISVQTRGYHFAYEEGGAASGTLVVQAADARSDFIWAAWEGVCLFVYELCRVQGEIGRSDVQDESRKARIPVRWTPG